MLHPRNRHRGRYDFDALIATNPDLAPHVKRNPGNELTIDFFNPAAVRELNSALLQYFYDIDQWALPDGALCPPIPGRAEYIHQMADLLRTTHPAFKGKKLSEVRGIRCLDVGVGAACIYPIIGVKEYGWHFVGSDISHASVASARHIIAGNPHLQGEVEIRLQANPMDTFKGAILRGERFDLTICNPPFHASAAEARASAEKKLTNLKAKPTSEPVLNFGGSDEELWCPGGELRFITDMIAQSESFGKSVFWFSTLVSKKDHLNAIYRALKAVRVKEVKTLQMENGNKLARAVAWTFL